MTLTPEHRLSLHFFSNSLSLACTVWYGDCIVFSARLKNGQNLPTNGSESGRGQPHSKTLARCFKGINQPQGFGVRLSPAAFRHGHSLNNLAIAILGLILLAQIGRAETFQLTTGESITGDVLPTSANELNVQIKIAEGDYQKVPWTSFSQEDLKKFAQNQRMATFVEPFIEVSQAEKIQKTQVNIKQPPRLQRPPSQSLLGAMLGSGPGLLILLLLYAANLYAGYEVAIFRAQSVPLVCGLSAIPFLGVAAPIVFLCMPTKMPPRAVDLEIAAASVSPEEAAAEEAALNPMAVAGAEHPGGLKIAHAEADQSKGKLPPTVRYQRGQFTFNRRFFETKFPGFFGVVRRDADRDMELVIKSARGEYTGQRISRIAANDLHLQVQKGGASEEVMIPFVEVQEIQLKHKDA
jgi:hypothetical protein